MFWANSKTRSRKVGAKDGRKEGSSISQKTPVLPPGFFNFGYECLDLEIHTAHAAAAHAAGHGWGAVLWLFGNHGFCRDQQ